MKIKNNSKNEWKEYNCGGEHCVTIPANSVIEVSDSIGSYLLRLLGNEKWLTQAEEGEKVTFEQSMHREANDVEVETEDSDYDKLKVSELETEIESRGLEVPDGKKADLVAFLVENDANGSVEEETVEEVEEETVEEVEEEVEEEEEEDNKSNE